MNLNFASKYSLAGYNFNSLDKNTLGKEDDEKQSAKNNENDVYNTNFLNLNENFKLGG